MSSRSASSCSANVPTSQVTAVFWINNEHGLESFTLDANPILIGSATNCDLQVNADGVHSKHAILEYHPLTKSFWLRDLQTSHTGGAIGGTTRNRKPIYGMVNLRNGDSIRFGKSAEHVFEMMPAIVQKAADKPHSSGHRRQTTSSSEGSSDRDSNITLPIVGHRIIPKEHRERFVRPAIVNQRLCKLRNVPRLVEAGKSLSQIGDNTQSPSELKRSASVTSDGNNNAKKKQKPRQKATLISSESEQSPGRLDRWNDLGVSIDSSNTSGTQLVQKIVRLQHELHRKELEIVQLKERLAQQQQQTLPQLASNTETSTNESANDQQKHASKEIVYETFFAVSCKEIEELSKRFYKNNSGTIRDYSDVFNEAYRLLQEPFSFRLMEVNMRCSKAFKHMQLSVDDKELLYTLLDEFFRDKLNPISKAFDAFLPILKEATGMARESVRACAVFSQWSREFGDQLQLNPNSDHMAYKVDDLQARFREHNLNKHWLPPSITPLLKILIYEFKTKVDELSRKEKEMNRLYKQLAEQRAQQNNPQIVEQNVDEEVSFLRNENQTLKEANTLLEKRLKNVQENNSVGQRFKREDRPLTAVGPRPSIVQVPGVGSPTPSRQRRNNTEVSFESCSQPSSQEPVESDEEMTDGEARAEKAPDLEYSYERDYDEQSQQELGPEINREVRGLPQLDSQQEGICESKNQIRDARSPQENHKEEGNPNEGHDGGEENQPPNGNGDEGDKSEDEGSKRGQEIREEEELPEPEEDQKQSKVEEDLEDQHSEIDKEPRPEADYESQLSNAEDDHFEEAPPSNFEEERSEADFEEMEQKDEGASDIEAHIDRPISAPQSSTYGRGEREQNAIEFWELAHLLAKALSVDLPDQAEADFSSIDIDEGINVEHHRREMVINSIMEKIKDILERLKLAEDQRTMTSRQQSVRSNKSNDDEQQSKGRSASMSNVSSGRRPLELTFHRVESIIEGESDI